MIWRYVTGCSISDVSKEVECCYRNYGLRKMEALHSFEISESDYPVMQPHIQRSPHEFNVHFPCIYITYVKFNTILLHNAFYLLISSLYLYVSALR